MGSYCSTLTDIIGVYPVFTVLVSISTTSIAFICSNPRLYLKTLSGIHLILEPSSKLTLPILFLVPSTVCVCATNALDPYRLLIV